MNICRYSPIYSLDTPSLNERFAFLFNEVCRLRARGGGGGSVTLTTTGSTGPATYTDGVLNIPNYSGGAATASNGLTKVSSDIRLGGALTAITTINTTGSYQLTVTGTNSAAANGASLAGINTSFGIGVYGESTSGGYGIYGTAAGGGYAIKGQATGTGYGGAFLSANGVGLTAASSSTTAATFESTYSSTNIAETVASLSRSTTNTPASGIGAALDFNVSTDAGLAKVSNRLISKWVTVADATRTSQFQILGVSSGTDFAYTFPPFIANRNVPLSVNGAFADAAGNITVAGGSGTPGGILNSIQFNSPVGTFAGTANILSDGTRININGSSLNSTFNIGSMEFQNYSLSNSWISDNVYFNGGGFVARTTGPGALFYFQGTEAQFRLGASVSAGASYTLKIPFKTNEDGTTVIGGDISTTSGTYTGATLLANNNGVSIGSGAVPQASSLLDLSSTTKALLLPRMTKAQRDAIVTKVAGHAVYQTDNTPGLRVYNGTNWMKYTETAD